MKTSSLSLAFLLSAGLCTPAYANLFSDNFEALVVADRIAEVPDSQGAPPTYTAIEGGYIEAGNPIAGENPPAVEKVRASLRNAFAAAGFQEGGGSSAVALTCFWGLLRIDTSQVHAPYDINSNYRARIELVSTQKTGEEVISHILGRKKGGGQDMNSSSIPILAGATETVVQDARHGHYFVIISAYDYASIAPGKEPKLLWQVKVSALESSGDMSEVIPGLIGTASAYLGKSLPEAKVLDSSPQKSSGSSGGTGEFGSYLDRQAVAALLHQERVEFSGTTGDSSGN